MKKYNIIYADPAWSYRDKRSSHKRLSGGAEVHYPTMSMQEIYDLPVKDIAAENSYLFLWVTFPNLPESLEVFNHWGFNYKTIGFNWIKTNNENRGKQYSFIPVQADLFFGIGYYTKSNSEICLLGTKGKVKPVSNYVSSIVIAPRKEHSKKPSIVRDKIVELCGDLPRVELFARQKTEGWDVWGNGVKDSIFIGDE